MQFDKFEQKIQTLNDKIKELNDEITGEDGFLQRLEKCAQTADSITKADNGDDFKTAFAKSKGRTGKFNLNMFKKQYAKWYKEHNAKLKELEVVRAQTYAALKSWPKDERGYWKDQDSAEFKKVQKAAIEASDAQMNCEREVRDLEYAAEGYSNVLGYIAQNQKKIAVVQEKISATNALMNDTFDGLNECLKKLCGELKDAVYTDLKETRKNIAEIWEKSEHDTGKMMEAMKKAGYAGSMIGYKDLSDSTLEKRAEGIARSLVVELEYRCAKGTTSRIVKTSNMRIANNGVLNGIVTRDDGVKFRVETILAGGYNIQVLHYRVLVNKI